ncbi:MAG: hypothetical protein Q4Q53_08640 [Methanocorpusculum sp.]|nr:hypothetical protein [Methanocorpusculum sp.]
MQITYDDDLFGRGLEFYVDRRHYDTIKNRRSSKTGLILILIAVVVIIGLGGVVGMYAASQAASSVVDSADVLLGVSVSGDDVIVDLFEVPADKEIAALTIVMEGYNIPVGLSTKTVTNDKVVYSGIAAGITGSKQVSFKALFVDGSVKTVWIDTLRFT